MVFKLKKSVIKNIVKECLVEILSEDFIKGVISENLKGISVGSNKKKVVSENVQYQQQQSNNLVDDDDDDSANVDGANINIFKSKILNNILEDTAKTTLPAQMQNETSYVRQRAQQSTNVIEENFSDGESHWSKILEACEGKK